ncbi:MULTISPECIES: hypothetical protein [Pseudomonas]|jgi:hypothetical protein|uniref:hypothetical protein n=1 Tax=Pseudomonas TaxID=286 RepID=UPI00054BA277|nr:MULTISPECIES: hypothetical protein [Pseudomonas]VVN38106.1 hypothetical protein PS682_05308 [Pseudomonas fluorescens]AVJ38692.1 hypothetical protein CLM75_15590 [Pseudomonas lurida]MBC3237323.1 hypothetical protein [Pseudomonas lurida]MBC3248466.1 hypothetical protein [Pseudomonas lurida]MBC3926273.1 hypothetical protein [Pseudomonas lurida]
MNKKPDLEILQGLLFTYSIENTKDLKREEIIVSKDINNETELSELFDELTKPDFLSYREDEQEWFIETIQHFLSANNDFESVFYLFDTYFEDNIIDKRGFMKTLLNCLKKYQEDANTIKTDTHLKHK